MDHDFKGFNPWPIVLGPVVRTQVGMCGGTTSPGGQEKRETGGCCFKGTTLVSTKSHFLKILPLPTKVKMRTKPLSNVFAFGRTHSKLGQDSFSCERLKIEGLAPEGRPALLFLEDIGWPVLVDLGSLQGRARVMGSASEDYGTQSMLRMSLRDGCSTAPDALAWRYISKI